MNVTRAVVTDLLPIYFSNEASGDTKVLVEDYFRQDPDFERIARSAATPLETLRAAAPIPASPEKKKRDLESVFWGLRRRTWLFGVSMFLTLAPLSCAFHQWPYRLSDGSPRSLASGVLTGALRLFFWFLYFARLPRRTAPLVCAISFTVIPIPFVLHSVFAGGPVGEFAWITWMCAALVWIAYFRQRPR